MQNSNFAALDLPAHLLDQAAKFGASLDRLSFAQLVVLVGRLDRSRQNAQSMQASASAADGLSPEFSESVAGLAAHVAVMFELVEAELERRLAGRAETAG